MNGLRSGRIKPGNLALRDLRADSFLLLYNPR